MVWIACISLLLYMTNGGPTNKSDSDILLNDLKNTMTEMQHDSEYVVFLERLSILYRGNDYSKSLQFAREAVMEAKTLKEKYLLARAYQNMGFAFNTDQSDSAEYYYRLSLPFFKRGTTDYARTLKLIGGSQAQQGGIDDALITLNEAIKETPAPNNADLISSDYLTIADYYSIDKMYDHALTYYLNLLSLAKSWKKDSLICSVEYDIAKVYLQLSDFNKALGYCRNAIDGYHNLGDSVDVAYSIPTIAECYEQLDSLGKAKSEMFRVFRILNQTRFSNLYIQSCSLLGDIYLQQNETGNAIRYYTRGVAACDSFNHETWKIALLKLYLPLSRSFDKIGNEREAFVYANLANEILDSMYSDVSAKTDINQKKAYQYIKKKQEVELLQSADNLKEAERNGLLGFAIFLSILLIALFFLFRQRQQLALAKVKGARELLSSAIKDHELNRYNSLIEGQEEERKRIAMDLHDRLGSMLATIKMHFSLVEEAINLTRSQTQQQYLQASELLDEACDEVRKISHNLSTGLIQHFGLQPALVELCKSIESSGAFKCKVLFFGIDKRLGTTIEIAVYRIVQELLSNVIKYANATSVIIQLTTNDNQLNLTVEDDGVGFNAEEKLSTPGIGLKNILLRTEQINGKFAIDSTKGKGTICILDVPISDTII